MCHTISEMANGPGGAHATVARSVSAVNSGGFAYVGVGFGFDEVTHPIVTVLISDGVFSYEHVKKNRNNETIIRGYIQRPSLKLLNYFRNVVYTAPALLHDKKIDFCLFVSGQTLVNNKWYKQYLKDLSPYRTCGGDMEGAGFFTACSTSNVECMLEHF